MAVDGKNKKPAAKKKKAAPRKPGAAPLTGNETVKRKTTGLKPD